MLRPVIRIKNSLAVLFGAAILTVASGASAQAERDPSLSVSLNQDTFFGFNPAFNGLIPVDDDLDISVYGIFWTNPALGTGAGFDLWTEFGGGVNLHFLDGKLQVQPQLGILSGVLLSGGNFEDGTATGDGIVFDGIVPNLTINYEDDTYVAQYYGGYYATARERNNVLANDFLHTWLNGGYKWNKYVSTGFHWELLENTRSTSGSPSTVYHWIGGFIGFNFGDGLFARFTAGADVEDTSPGNFYKMSVGYAF